MTECKHDLKLSTDNGHIIYHCTECHKLFLLFSGAKELHELKIVENS